MTFIILEWCGIIYPPQDEMVFILVDSAENAEKDGKKTEYGKRITTLKKCDQNGEKSSIKHTLVQRVNFFSLAKQGLLATYATMLNDLCPQTTSF